MILDSETQYTLGTLAELTATFTVTATGLVGDPSSVVIAVRKPDGTVSHPGVTRLSTGVYQVSVTVDQAGQWRWKAAGSGGVQVVSDPEDGVFTGVPPSF